jgi:quercetin dioxygenase-like cupin family protein
MPMAAKPMFTSMTELPGKELGKGVTIKPLALENLMLLCLEFAPHAEVPTHSHPHEQIGLILEGELDMWIGEERRTLRPGDMYKIPGNVPHGGRTGASHAFVVDAFHPLREDYLKLFA